MNDYYKQGKVETVEKQEAIARWLSSAGIPADKIAHVTTFVKYIDRMGAKDGEPFEKDARKAADYACRAITGKWIPEDSPIVEDGPNVALSSPTDDIDRFVTIGQVPIFPDATPDKEQALKPIEEAAEVFGAWQECENQDLCPGICASTSLRRRDLVNECCDLIQATCNLLASIGVADLTDHMRRCAERNRERGRM